MKIHIYEFTEGAEKACGLTVIIDVLRAFSVACYLFHRGIRSLRITEQVHHAFRLQKHDPHLVLVGERNERKVPGFQFGNSPNEIIHADLSGKDVVQTTSAGTLGLSRATSADILITGSFVNAGAIIQYIRMKKPEQVSLVAMGYRAQTSADEDRLCAEYIKKQLEGTPTDFQNMIFSIRNGTGNRFFNPLNRDHSPPEDFELCMALNRFPFILLATPKQDGIHLKKIYSSSFH